LGCRFFRVRAGRRRCSGLDLEVASVALGTVAMFRGDNDFFGSGASWPLDLRVDADSRWSRPTEGALVYWRATGRPQGLPFAG
jgi:hypothetical protein